MDKNKTQVVPASLVHETPLISRLRPSLNSNRHRYIVLAFNFNDNNSFDACGSRSSMSSGTMSNQGIIPERPLVLMFV